ncbi:MAG: hypothetical protein M3092_05030, partial [Actinomycetia bacterium]|nr:hypothetical protein [Actinomycetes bacterium]
MKHRTAIITAASIVVVMVAATAAIATNLGILDSATTASDVGTLSIETIETVPPTVVAIVETPPAEIVVVEDASATESSDSVTNGVLSAYAVGDAGIVTLGNNGAILTIVDIETNPGWATTEVVEEPSIEIRFVGTGGGSLQFTAHLDDAGEIVTAVNDLTAAAVIVVTETVYEDDAPVANASVGSGSEGTETSSSSSSYDDDDEYDDDDDGYDDDAEDDEDEEEDEDE